jgi:hypothetical protein
MTEKTTIKKGFKAWLALVFISVLSAFVVPYAILTTQTPSLAIYGFWTLFALVIVGFIYWGVKDWRDEQ